MRLGTQVEVRDLEVWSQGVFKATILGKIIQCMSVDRFRASAGTHIVVWSREGSSKKAGEISEGFGP